MGDRLEAAELGESITINDEKFGGVFNFDRYDGRRNMYKHESKDGSWVYFDDAYGKWMISSKSNGLKEVNCDNFPVCL